MYILNFKKVYKLNLILNGQTHGHRGIISEIPLNSLLLNFRNYIFVRKTPGFTD